MQARHGRIWLAAVAVLAVFGALGPVRAAAEERPQPRNVVLLIGDGMGPMQVRLAALFAYGEGGTLEFEKLPFRAHMTTDPIGKARIILGRTIKPVTDSAAAGTAMATGRKVKNGVLSAAIPGDGEPMRTVLEIFRDRGARTGLVTTDGICGATPAAFGAHTRSRADGSGIARGYLTETRPNVLMGGASSWSRALAPEAVRAAGYAVVTNRREMAALEPGKDLYVSGQFGEGAMPYEYEYAEGLVKQANEEARLAAEELAKEGLRPRVPYAPRQDYDTLPHLSEMAGKALELLDNPKGLFLMIESATIDHACHKHQLYQYVHEVLEFEKTFRVVWEWARGRTDTLVLVTADHETGGLGLVRGWGKSNLAIVDWKTWGHTGTPVPVYGWGAGAERVAGMMDNTDLFEVMTGLPKPPPPKDDAAGVRVPAGALYPGD